MATPEEIRDALERADRALELPVPAPEPEREPADSHAGPLDDDEDGRYLSPFDPRRIDAERRRGRPFDQDSEGGP
jgi:hypothetical protein